jgi:heat shock protein HslJ/uncharacterized membrane protein
MRHHVWTLLAAALAVSACQSAPPSTAPAGDHPLVNTAWQVRDLNERPVPTEAVATLVIESRERVSGHAGCNRYFGRVGLDGSNIVISQMGSTRMACAAPVMEQEQRVLAALQAVAYWERRDEVLLLIDGEGRQRLRLYRVTAPSRAATDSLVVATPPGRTAVFQALGHAPAWTLEVRPDAMVFVREQGAQRVTASTPAAQGEPPGDTIYTAVTATGQLIVRIRAAACTDALSGLGYPATVEIVLNGITHRGCGHWSR